MFIFKKISLSLFVCLTACTILIPSNVSAQFNNTPGDREAQMNTFSSTIGVNKDASLGIIVSKVIYGFLGILAIFFVSLVVYAGFLWMNARGSSEEVDKAKKIIQMAVIGLAIIVGAYSITFFVFQALLKAGLGASGTS